jgi:uncharacterized membrane-anchored protein YitT (DUF2179 family)
MVDILCTCTFAVIFLFLFIILFTGLLVADEHGIQLQLTLSNCSREDSFNNRMNCFETVIFSFMCVLIIVYILYYVYDRIFNKKKKKKKVTIMPTINEQEEDQPEDI